MGVDERPRSDSLKLALFVLLALVCGLFAGWRFGFDEGAEQAREAARPLPVDLTQIAGNTAGREAVACPAPGEAYVIALFGQSNSANSAGHRFAARPDEQILNRYEGTCYRARDPMLGATGKGGSIAIPLARALNAGKPVVIESFGVSNSRASDWLPSGVARPVFDARIAALAEEDSRPDFVLWFQGESDIETEPESYRRQLRALMREVRQALPGVPLGLTGTSYCAGSDNPAIVAIQREVADELDLVFLGETDAIRTAADRYDGCHLSERGALKVAAALGSVIGAQLPD